METDNARVRKSQPTQGGAVEPANRAAVAKALFQTPLDVPAERYELRDPFADVTYRSNTMAEIIATADRLDSHRFIAIASDGRRTTMQRIDGEWQRGQERPAATPRPLDPLVERDEVPDVADRQAPNEPARSSREHQAEPAGAERAPTRIEAEGERAALLARIEAALSERYVIKRAPVSVGEMTVGRTEYRFRGDTTRVAFVESTFRLATDTNSPSVARSMVDVAQARNWQALRVSGNEEFKRLVWLEASVRGVRAIGYEATHADLTLVKREREARAVNRIEPTRSEGQPSASASASNEKGSTRGGGRKAVLAAIEAVLIAKKVPEARRESVMAAAAERLTQRISQGRPVMVRVYDKAAPSHRSTVPPPPEHQRSRERAPAR